MLVDYLQTTCHVPVTEHSDQCATVVIGLAVTLVVVLLQVGCFVLLVYAQGWFQQWYIYGN